ncbi:MAG: polysaccharide deacetylase family protein [Dokdonella sp.]
MNARHAIPVCLDPAGAEGRSEAGLRDAAALPTMPGVEAGSLRVNRAPAANSRRLCIALHDVAPATWPQCALLLDLLDELGAPPLTLLVVPDYHHRGRIDADRGFMRAIEHRLARGDEVALHGYFHLDDGPPPRTPTDWLRRRHLTASEGEFAALSDEAASARIANGLGMLERIGWPVHGFVAPAWLLGAGARTALRRTALRYTSTHTHLELPAQNRRIAAPVISASTRSAWRRWASKRWFAGARRLHADAPLLRVALHPADAQHADMLDAWRGLLQPLLGTRLALTKSVALGLA